MVKISDVLGYQPIDIHTHLDHGVDGDRRVLVGESQSTIHRCELDLLKAEYDSVGICCGAFSTFSSLSRAARTIEENDYLHTLSENTDWIYQWLALDPNQDANFDQVDRLLSSPKVLGIKLHVWHNYDILEYGDKIFSFANERGAFVMMHPDKIPQMPAFADKYPNMKLIIAHVGSEDHINAVAAAKHGNIYLDTSGGASNFNNVIELAVERLGSDNILFGTDTYSSAFQVGRIAWARISDADKKKILRDNAKRLFPEVFKNV